MDQASPVSCRECRSLWWRSLWRTGGRTSPQSRTRSPSCLLSWSSWWTVEQDGDRLTWLINTPTQSRLRGVRSTMFLKVAQVLAVLCSRMAVLLISSPTLSLQRRASGVKRGPSWKSLTLSAWIQSFYIICFFHVNGARLESCVVPCDTPQPTRLEFL